MAPALLRGRVFRRYRSASAISMFGEQVSGVALLLPTPLPRYRLPAVDGPARA